jgi:hypothetical protein
MIGPPEEWRPILDALIAAPIACQSPAQVAEALGSDVEETTELLSRMDLEGWIDVWDGDAGPIVTLTPLAAERLQVVLVEYGPDETPRWARAGEPVPPPPRAKHVCRSERHASLEGLIDPDPPPDVVAERAERSAVLVASLPGRRLPPAGAEGLPRPTLLLGQGLTPWPGPGQSTDVDCPSCGNRPLLPHVYCICCDSWGLDPLLEELTLKHKLAGERPSPPLPTAPILVDRASERRLLQQQQQLERARRKARRKVRRAARR